MPVGAVDVAIVGGGPAGCAAALTILGRSQLTVAVIERSWYQDARAGESVSSGLLGLLEDLDLKARFLGAGHLRGVGSRAAWGCREPRSLSSMFAPTGEGWHLDRGRFDRMMARAVLDRGGALYVRTRPTRIDRRPDGVFGLRLKHSSRRPFRLDASFLIDATGQSALIARRLGAERVASDRLVGAVAFLQPGSARSPRREILIEAVADGWWYSVALPGDRLVVAFMTDGDILRRCHAHRPEGWNRQLAAAALTGDRASGGVAKSGLQIRSARTQCLRPAGAAGWLAAGDAVAAFDPLASLGIGHAVASGCAAARRAIASLLGDGDDATAYCSDVERNVASYAQMRRQYYRMEQRWPEAPFWRRRHAAER